MDCVLIGRIVIKGKWLPSDAFDRATHVDEATLADEAMLVGEARFIVEATSD